MSTITLLTNQSGKTFVLLEEHDDTTADYFAVILPDGQLKGIKADRFRTRTETEFTAARQQLTDQQFESYKNHSEALNAAAARNYRSGANHVAAGWTATRLKFIRSRIDPLTESSSFECRVTGIGVYRMTKAEFKSHFSNVVKSESYRNLGVYTYAQLPRHAAKFRVADA